MHLKIIVLAFFSSVIGTDWCAKEMNCESKENSANPEFGQYLLFKKVMCEKSNSDRNCLEPKDLLTEHERMLLLENHNYFRYRFTKDPPFHHMPLACKLGKLTWDTKLEEMAKKWAVKCPLAMEFCERPKDVGQTMVVVVSREDVPATSLLSSFNKLLEPLRYFEAFDPSLAEGLVRSFRQGPWNGAAQIIWGATTKVGCSYMSFKINDNVAMSSFIEAPGETDYFRILVCNYSPAGAIEGQAMYDTNCPESQVSTPEPNPDEPNSPLPYHDSKPKEVILIPACQLGANGGEQFVTIADDSNITERPEPTSSTGKTTTIPTTTTSTTEIPDHTIFSSSPSLFYFSELPITLTIPRFAIAVEAAPIGYFLLMFFHIYLPNGYNALCLTR